MEYNPPASVVPFLLSDKFANFILGPVGSTKTTASLIKLVMEAKRIAPCPDGIRRSRVAIVRNTSQMLSDTTIPDFLKWYGNAGVFQKTPKNFQLKIDDVECEVLFRGLDDPDDVRRLLSLQLTFAIMDEFREIHRDIYEALTGRIGRYPDKTMNGVGPCEIQPDGSTKQIHKVWAASNPPDVDTYWEEQINNPAENVHVTIQPSGLSPEADWVQYLPDGYYENLCKGKGEDWIDVYVHGKFGRSLSGKPVFRGFNKDTHVSKQELRPVLSSTYPIIVGFDCTGLGPAAVIGQIGFGGRLYIYDAVWAEDMGPIRFIREVLKPLLVNKYAGAQVAVVIDPAGMARGGDERSVVDLLRAEGLAARPAHTNAITARISAVEHFLTRTVDGKSGLVIDPSLTDLIHAFTSKYRYKVKQNGEVEDKPQKIRPWADLMDALQYLCLHADGGTMFGHRVKSSRREIVQVSAAGWT